MPACPHCETPIQLPPDHWLGDPPYACFACSGLFGFHFDQTYEVPPLQPLKLLMTYQQAAYWSHYVGNHPYVYAICFPNGLPFYIGKGRAQRIFAHAHFLKHHPTTDTIMTASAKDDEILRLLLRTTQERYALLAVCKNDKEAFAIESALIDQWGIRPKGPLVNVTRSIINVPWVIPPQPDIVVDCGDDKDREPWAIHPIINQRYAVGISTIWCPLCRQKSKVPPSRNLQNVRCPHCCHFFEVDGTLIYKAYSEYHGGIKRVEFPYPGLPYSNPALSKKKPGH